MLSLRALVPLALVVGLVAVPAGTAAPNAKPVARAAGGDVVALTYPALVNVPLMRARAALDRASEYADDAQAAKAVAQLKVVQTNMTKAWTGAKYLIDNAPPAPPAEDLVGPSATTGSSFTFASAEETGFEVLNLQHDVVTTAAGLMDSGDASVATALGTTINAAIKARNTAITYIQSKAPAAPPAEDRTAQASGAPVVAGDWTTLMPSMVPLLDDELQQIDGLLGRAPTVTPAPAPPADDRTASASGTTPPAGGTPPATGGTTPPATGTTPPAAGTPTAAAGTLSAASKTVLRTASRQILLTKNNVNRFWPPVPADD